MGDSFPIAVASDHAGLELKDQIIQFLQGKSRRMSDFGAHSRDSVDYPDYGTLVAEAVSCRRAWRGILVCATGIGMSIVANKFPGIRAALCHELSTARLSRLHNDANVLVLGEKALETAKALDIVEAWFSTGFDGGRHSRRISKIQAIEKPGVRT